MERPNKQNLLGSKTGYAPQFHGLPSSRTISPTDSLSERESKHEQSSSELESPPPELINDCAQSCSGLWNGCSYGEHHQLHCRLRCSPRACKQCREVGDAEWIRRGQWLEDCISWDEDDEYQRNEKGIHTRRAGVNNVIAISALAVISAAIFYWIYRARHMLELA